MRDKFNSYPLNRAVDFQSSYTWRFYEVLVSWAQSPQKTKGQFMGWIKEQSVDELRSMLGVPKSYSWAMFEKRVLDVAVNEIREQAQVAVFIERIKTVRKITHLNITFVEEQQIPIPLEN